MSAKDLSSLHLRKQFLTNLRTFISLKELKGYWKMDPRNDNYYFIREAPEEKKEGKKGKKGKKEDED